ncbi:MAG: c-type cytochrome, partial [Myxococcota bacterium]
PYTPDDMAKAAYEKAKAAGADAKTNAKSGDAAAIAAGKAHYETRCASCHGAAGKGDGVAGAALPQKPADFTDKDRWAFTSVGVKHWVTMNGIQGTAMAPLGLTDDQAWEVLAYIESEFAKK